MITDEEHQRLRKLLQRRSWPCVRGFLVSLAKILIARLLIFLFYYLVDRSQGRSQLQNWLQKSPTPNHREPSAAREANLRSSAKPLALGRDPCDFPREARVAELADALDSGSEGRIS